jgi:hypothetical protein
VRRRKSDSSVKYLFFLVVALSAQLKELLGNKR